MLKSRPDHRKVAPMSPVTLIEHSLFHCLDFKGRAGRAEFWLWIGFSLLMTAGFYFIGLNAPLLSEIWKAWFAISFLFGVSLTVRRLHDMDLSGKWFLIIPVGILMTFAVATIAPDLMAQMLWIPVALVMVLYFVVGFVPGPAGENRFGHAFPPRKLPFA
nr:DUF805 domain-containing protein [uncultured Cohaesibacter sp.]